MVKTGKSGKEKHLECLIYSLSFDKYRFKEIVHSKNTILSPFTPPRIFLFSVKQKKVNVFAIHELKE